MTDNKINKLMNLVGDLNGVPNDGVKFGRYERLRDEEIEDQLHIKSCILDPNKIFKNLIQNGTREAIAYAVVNKLILSAAQLSYETQRDMLMDAWTYRKVEENCNERED